MFTPSDREDLREALILAARADHRVASAALTGSAARGAEDRWSDIDLALGLTPGADRAEVMAAWTEAMQAAHGAVHHLDVVRGRTIYRVFLLASTLQVDVAFALDGEFRATGPAFRLLFGGACEPRPAPPPEPAELIGLGWLYALHARSSLARGRVWQAEYMISGMREQVLALMCLRYGTAPHQGRGLDDLPAGAIAAVAGALAGSVEAGQLWRAFGVATRALLAEARLADATLADRLTGPVTELARPVPAGPLPAG